MNTEMLSMFSVFMEKTVSNQHNAETVILYEPAFCLIDFPLSNVS